jgi:HAD superfamily hydrolase (TIGR01509 family)
MMTRNKASRAVIFDMDGVLCRYDLKVRLAALASRSGRAPEEVERLIWGSGFEEDADSGRYASGADYLKAFGEQLGCVLSAADWIAARKASMTPNLDVLALVGALRPVAKLALLSNNGPLTEETFAELFPEAAALFGPALFFSWSFGVKKPSPEIYHEATRRLGVAPADAVFIDDKAHNVAGAAAAGLTAFRFSTAEQLMKDLAAAQVL